jgi:hypothetical protein|tara:strand:- start:19 stop:1269 length:1251 start_codon:yes stop_codon:yes gene_type:complete
MNQSELAAYILTRERIVKQIDNIVEHGGSQDTLKRLRRFGNAFSWYPEFYPQILEGVGGMTDKQLMSALRTEDGFMKLIAPVEGLPIHHVFASRTGGDLPLRTPADVFLDVRQRTFDRYGFGAGPNPLNLGAHSAFDNRMHMGQYGPKGTAFDKARGLGSPPTSEMPMLHNPETKNIGAKLGQDPVLLRSQSDEIFDALTPFLDSQYEIFEEVSSHPVTRQQRAVIESNVDQDAFARGRTPEQSTAVRKIVKEKGLDTEFALKFDFSKATATTNAGELVLKRNPFANRLVSAGKVLTKFPGPLDDVALGTGFGGVAAVAALATGGDPAQAFGDVVSDVAAGDLQGGELFDESQDFGEALQQSRQQNARPLMDRLDEGALGDAGRAIKRGGRLSIGAHGAKFTLPEFGFSEFFGINK